MKPCECRESHHRRRVVLTGGPGAGKTAVLELIRASFCTHVKVLPEAAGVIFGGGFPRSGDDESRRAAQRAIFYVQRELEAAADVGNPAIVLCDRGTIDGAAYWPGPNELWSAVGTALDEQLRRYDAVVHLRTPAADIGYNWQNPLRTETAAQAADIDDRILHAWEQHPRRFVIEASSEFLVKAARAVEILRDEMPECCKQHVVPVFNTRSFKRPHPGHATPSPSQASPRANRPRNRARRHANAALDLIVVDSADRVPTPN